MRGLIVAKILYTAIYIYTLVEHVPRHTGHAGTCLAQLSSVPWTVVAQLNTMVTVGLFTMVTIVNPIYRIMHSYDPPKTFKNP